MWQSLDRSLRRIFFSGNIIASVFLAVIMVLMSGEIIGRYLFNHPIPEVDPIVRTG